MEFPPQSKLRLHCEEHSVVIHGNKLRVLHTAHTKSVEEAEFFMLCQVIHTMQLTTVILTF